MKKKKFSAVRPSCSLSMRYLIRAILTIEYYREHILNTISSFGINMGKNLGDWDPNSRKRGIRVV